MKPINGLNSLPAFKALEKTLAALVPLNPEERRRVVEAVHALLPISAGTKQDQDKPAADPASRAKRRRR